MGTWQTTEHEWPAEWLRNTTQSLIGLGNNKALAKRSPLGMLGGQAKAGTVWGATPCVMRLCLGLPTGPADAPLAKRAPLGLLAGKAGPHWYGKKRRPPRELPLGLLAGPAKANNTVRGTTTVRALRLRLSLLAGPAKA